VDNPDNPLLDIDGVLHVDPAFTVVVDNKPGNASKVDSGVEEMYLPMNSDRSNDTGNGRCFPVAPMALKNEDMVWIPNAEKHITHEYLRSWDVNMQVLNGLYDYFRTKQPVGSVIANPLVYGDTKLGWWSSSLRTLIPRMGGPLSTPTLPSAGRCSRCRKTSYAI